MKTLKSITIVSALILAFGFNLELDAQDAHYTQFDASPVMLNPATTGVFDNSDWRASARFRSQWGSLGTNFLTTSVAFDMPFKDRIGIGGYFQNYDMASTINVTNLVGSGSYEITEPGNGDYRLTAGLQLGFMIKSLNMNSMIFDNQYDEGLFNEDLPTGEIFERGAKFSPDVNLGMFYQMTDESKEFIPWGSLSLFHAVPTKDVFISNVKARVPLRWMFSGGGTWQADEKLKILPSLLYMKQRADWQVDVNVLGQYHVEETEYDVIGGFSWRSSDAIAFHAGVHHRENIFRISYDFNVSSLNEFTRSRGAIEFSLLYYGFNSVKKKLPENTEEY
ncbi:MAG: PorP/SprF family type IX secretion system membrane protein [Bacteroidota bacterium]